LEGELWHDGCTFATVKVDGHIANFSIKSSSYRRWLTRTYGQKNIRKVGDKLCPAAPSAQAVNEAINAIDAAAVGGPERQAAIRVAGHNGSIYLDLGQPEWSAVEISSDGWRIIDAPPARFIRPMGLRPLPTPVRGGNILELRKFLNVATDADFVLVVAWLLAALRPVGPYPVHIINAEHGAGKTLTCRVIRRLIDPNSAELRSAPRDERDLLLAAKNGWIVALDNLSYVKNDLSDAICRIATKGGFATRALYTDGEEYLLEVSRPVLLNGIPALASRPDLADRAVVILLPTISEDKRQSEEEFWRDFQSAAPRILGALLDGVCGALRLLPSIQLHNPTRMMDFAKWSEAACQALGAAPGVFEAAYAANRSTANQDALDADPVAGAVIDLMAGKGHFLGTATELLSKLKNVVMPTSGDRYWPKDGARLSGRLRKLAPCLRQVGIEILFDAHRDRLIEIKRAK
jgi:hypothetical protein